MSSNQPIRLQRYLSLAGVSSRRHGEELILNRRVSVNGECVSELGTKVTPGTDKVLVDGKPIALEEKRTYCFHKPINVITTMSDPRGRPTINDYVKKLPVRVVPVGRLDFDVSGLLLLTNDGDYAHQLLHPKFGVERTYWAVVEGKPDSGVLGALKKGVQLPDGFGRASRAKLVSANKQTEALFGKLESTRSVIELSVSVGRKHFVKNILATVGYPVEKLCRISFGPYSLGILKPGELAEVRQQKKLQ